MEQNNKDAQAKKTKNKVGMIAAITTIFVAFILCTTVSLIVTNSKRAERVESIGSAEIEKQDNQLMEPLEEEPSTYSYSNSTEPETNLSKATEEATEPQVETWADIPKVLGKKYKVMGIWQSSGEYGQTLILYKKNGKHYLCSCNLSEQPIDEDFAYPLKVKKKGIYIYNQAGSDMPEMFCVNGEQLISYTYNPDVNGGEWVYMGSYEKLY